MNKKKLLPIHVVCINVSVMVVFTQLSQYLQLKFVFSKFCLFFIDISFRTENLSLSIEATFLTSNLIILYLHNKRIFSNDENSFVANILCLSYQYYDLVNTDLCSYCGL